jgi:two-component system chemotaxis response regulator CheY
VAARPVNILVVDDDLELCTMLSRFLEMHGYTVYSAADALQALDILERNQVGMVITDYLMPHMDGIRFTEMLKAEPRFQAIPVLLMTGSQDEGITDKGLRKGVALTLHKPLDMGQLLTLVRFAE